MDVEMPDGTIITDVPEGTTKAELMRRLGMTKPPSQEWMAKTMASMTLAGKPWYERAAIQMGAGVDTLGKGLRQLFAGEEENKRLQREVAQDRLLKKALAEASDTKRLPEWMPTAGSALQVAGEVLPTMAVPFGTYTTAARALPRAVGLMRGPATPARMGTGALITESAIGGGVSGALTPTAEGESRAENVLLGTGAGAVTPAVLAGGRQALNIVTPGGGRSRAGAQIAEELTQGAADQQLALQQTIQNLRAQSGRQGPIPLSVAAQLRDPQLARLEAGSRARSGANWYDFDQAQAQAVSDELMRATRGAENVGTQRAARSANREILYNQAMRSINEPAFLADLSRFKSNLEVATLSPEASNPAVRNMLTQLSTEIDRLGQNFTPEHLATIRANLAKKAPLVPTNAYDAVPRDNPATMSVLREVDNILNNATNNRWQDVLSAYKRDSDIVRSAQAAGKVREAFIDPATGRVRGVSADVAGEVPKITEAGLGRAMDVARGPRRELVLDPTVAARLEGILGALRQQNIVQGVKRSATAGGGSNTASDLMAARAAQQAGDVVAGMAGGIPGAIAKGTIDRAIDVANTFRDRALAEALQDPQRLIALLERRLAAGQPLSAAETSVLQILRSAPAAAATN